MNWIKEFLQFMKERKKLWMVPIIIVLIGIAFLAIAGQTSLFTSLIYTLF